jgi:hypothetical protein
MGYEISMYEGLKQVLTERLLELEAVKAEGFPVEARLKLTRKLLRRLPDISDGLSRIVIKIGPSSS